MSASQTNHATSHTPLRLWPGVTLAAALVLLRFVAPLVAPDVPVFGAPLAMLGFIGGVAFGALILVWWLLFSRAPWLERLGALAAMAVALAITRLLLHPSIENGMMGVMLYVFSVPVLGVALVAWAAAARGLVGTTRWLTMAGAIALACGTMLVIRTGGVSGEGLSDLHWRWTETPEERLLAQAEPARVPPPAPAAPAAPAPAAPAPAAPTAPAALTAPVGTPQPAPDSTRLRSADSAPASAGQASPRPPAPEWPSFRGPHRDGIVKGVHIETDWPASAPVEMWRRPIGPGWSSFAVAGDLLYTQEQRGEHEIVSSYRVSTGEPVWQHRDPVRFWESNGGAGPRATPTLHGGRVYTMGATGVVNALDAATGALLWTRNAATDTGTAVPDWGFAGSPLVVDDVAVVAVSGQLAGYDAQTGATRWVGQSGGGGYSSPHLAIIDGVTQVLFLRGARTISVAPSDGTLLWEHVWEPSVSIVQPAMVDARDVLVNNSDGMGGGGIRRLAITKDATGWHVDARWTTRGLKPYFNDFVVHEGHAFGFDGSILACIDLADGARKWKGGRYGHGQMVLLPDQDLLLVLSEDGELALVKATPDRFTEVARVRALEGKTWNHPVLVGDTLLVRNGEEMAAFKMRRAP
jgi:outer membrane protein assembly factor BamB